MPISDQDVLEIVVPLWRLKVSSRFMSSTDSAEREAQLQELIRDCRHAPDAQTLQQWLRAFLERGGGEMRPSWGQFAAFMRNRARESKGGKYMGEPRAQCFYCDGSGLFPVAYCFGERHRVMVPEPPAPWDGPRLYRFVVPCLCTRGDYWERRFARQGQLQDCWEDLRAAFRAWYDSLGGAPGGPIVALDAYVGASWHEDS